MMTSTIENLADALGRALDAEEQEMVEFMSPQGIAKMNADICKGADMEETIAEMLWVFQLMKKRRTRVESSLPESAQSIIKKMNRPLTTDEMVFLAEANQTMVYTKIFNQLSIGEELEDILEDLAVEHRQKQLLFDAQRMANAQGMAVSISRLAPTKGPQATVAANLGLGLGTADDDQDPTTSTMIAATRWRANKIRMGLSPVVSWFEDRPRTPGVSTPIKSTPSITSPYDGFALSSPKSNVSTPRGVLKPCAGGTMCSSSESSTNRLRRSVGNGFTGSFSFSSCSQGASSGSLDEQDSTVVGESSNAQHPEDHPLVQNGDDGVVTPTSLSPPPVAAAVSFSNQMIVEKEIVVARPPHQDSPHRKCRRRAHSFDSPQLCAATSPPLAETSESSSCSGGGDPIRRKAMTLPLDGSSSAKTPSASLPSSPVIGRRATTPPDVRSSRLRRPPLCASVFSLSASIANAQNNNTNINATTTNPRFASITSATAGADVGSPYVGAPTDPPLLSKLKEKMARLWW